MVTLVKSSQSKNAKLPIDVAFPEISTLVKLVQFSNAKSPYYSPRVVAADFDSKKKGEAKSAAYPFLTVYGTTNYRDFGDAITGALLRNGFVARTLFVAGRRLPWGAFLELEQ